MGWRLGIRQHFDRRPQLIDQRCAITDLFPLLGTGQSVPQSQKPLGAERGGVQFFLRRDSNLALVHGGRIFAAQRNAVIAEKRSFAGK